MCTSAGPRCSCRSRRRGDRSPLPAGVVAMYLLVAVEATSLLKKHLPKKVWKSVHFSSYPLFAFATLHGVTAGTDTGTTFVALVVATVVIVVGALTVARLHAAEDQLDARDARRDRLAGLARHSPSERVGGSPPPLLC